MPSSFRIPDLAKLCSEHFKLRVNQHCRAVSDASCQWVDGYHFLTEKECARLPSMQFALLAALWYPTCDVPQLRAATDLLVVLFHWHDRPEGMSEASEAAFGRFVGW